MTHSLLLAIIAIFVALDIVGAVPTFIAMTAAMTDADRKRVLDVSMLVAFLTAVAFAVGGLQLFSVLGITVSDFKIAGGIVLLLLSLADLVGHAGPENGVSGSTGIVPLAVPLITGPAVLTTLILQIRQAGYAYTLIALLVNYVLAWALLRKSDTVTKIIGKDGSVVFSKIAALLLAAIAVAMIRGGAFEAIMLFRSLYS